MSDSISRKATQTTTIRLTPDEAVAVAAAASARGMGPSTFVRAAALRAAKRPAPAAKRRAGPDAEALARLTGEMGRIGGLMKVLTVQAREGRVPADALAAVAAEWTALRDSILDATRGDP